MKTFVTFNQANFLKIGELKGIKVDTVDATLFDWIKTFSFSEKALKIVKDNNIYIWVSYKAIREDNPLCGINTNDVVGRRLNKLVDLGILKKLLLKEYGNKTFFCITEFAFTYLLESRELPTQKSEPLPTQKSDNSKLIDSKLDNNIKNTKKEDPFLKIISECIIELEKMNYNLNRDSYADFKDHRKEIKKPLTKRQIKSHIKLLCKYPLDIQKQMIETSINSGWAGLFEIKNNKRINQNTNNGQIDYLKGNSFG